MGLWIQSQSKHRAFTRYENWFSFLGIKWRYRYCFLLHSKSLHWRMQEWKLYLNLYSTHSRYIQCSPKLSHYGRRCLLWFRSLSASGTEASRTTGAGESRALRCTGARRHGTTSLAVEPQHCASSVREIFITVERNTRSFHFLETIQTMIHHILGQYNVSKSIDND